MKKTSRKTATAPVSMVYDARPALPRETASVAADERLTSLVGHATWEVGFATEELAGFQAKLAKDSADAFEWSSVPFRYAARKKVSEMVLTYVKMLQERGDEYSRLSADAVLKFVQATLHRDVVRGARCPEYSTSMQSNLMAQAVLAQKAEYLERLEGGL